MPVTGAEIQLKITGDNSGAVAALQQTEQQAQATTGNINNTLSQVLIGHTLENWGNSALGFANDFVTAGADFQQSIEFINRLTSSTADGFDELQNKAITLARTSIFSAQDIVNGMEQLAREGFSVSQIVDGGMNSMIDASTNMATALGTSIPESANMIGQLERVFADQGLNAGQVADIVTQAVLRSGQGLQQFAGGLQYVAAQADMTNTPLSEVASMVSYLESELIKGRNAGTSLRTMFQNLEAPTGKVADELATLGVNTVGADGNFIGLKATIGLLHDAYGNLSPSAQEAANKVLFGAYATSATLELIRGGIPAMDAYAAKEADVGSAADIAHVKMGNLAGSLHNLTSSIFDVKIVLGEAVAGVLKPFIDLINQMIGVFLFMPTPVHMVAAVLIVLVGALASLTGAIILFNAVGGMELVGASVAAALGVIGGAVAAALPVLIVIGVVVAGVVATLALLGVTLGNVKDDWNDFWRVFHGTQVNDAKNWHFGELASDIDALGNAIKFVFGQSAFTDWLNRTALATQTAINVFDRLTSKGVNPLAAALEALGFAVTGSGLAGLGNFIVGLGKDFDIAAQAFEKFRSGGVDPLTSALYALSAVFASHDLTGLANWFGILGDAVDAFVQGDYGAALDDFTASLKTLLETAAHGVTVTIPKVLVSIGSWAWGHIVQPLGDWILGHLPGLSDLRQGASAATITVASIAVSIKDWAWGAVRDLGGWMQAHLFGWTSQGAAPHGSIAGSASGAGGGADLGVTVPIVHVGILGWVVSDLDNLYKRITDFVFLAAGGGSLRNDVSAMEGNGVPIKSVAVSILGWTAGKIADIGVWLAAQLRSAEVALIGPTVNVIGWTAGKVADVGLWLAGKLRTAETNLVSIKVNVANWAAGNIAGLTVWLSKTEQGVYVDLKSIMVSIANWAPGTIADLGTWLYGLLRNTKVFLVTVAVSIANWSIDLTKSNLAQAIISAIGDVLAASKDLPAKIGAAVVERFQKIDWTTIVTKDSFDFGVTVGTAIHDAVDTSVKAIANADWGAILDDVGVLLQNALPLAEKTILAVGSAFISFFMGALISSLIGPDAAKSFSDFISSLVDGIQQTAKDGDYGAAAKAIASGLWNAVVQWFKDNTGIQAIVDAIQGGDGATTADGKNTSGYSPPPGSPGSVTDPNGGTSNSAPSKLFGGMLSGGSGAFDALARNVGADVRQIDADLVRNSSAFTDLGTKINAALTNIAKDAQTSGAAVNRNLTAGLTAAKTSAAALFTAMNVTATVWATELGIHATSAGTWVNQRLTAGLAAAKASAGSILTAINTTMTVFANEAAIHATSAGQAFNQRLANGLAAAASTAQSYVNEIIGILASGADSAYWAGKQFGLGFANGLSSEGGAVQNAAAALANAALNTTRNVGGVASPSKKMMEIANFYVDGFLAPFTSRSRDVALAVGTMIGFSPSGALGALGSSRPAMVSHSNANHYTNVNVTVPAANFPEWIKTVEFVQSLSRSRQQVKGVA